MAHQTVESHEPHAVSHPPRAISHRPGLHGGAAVIEGTRVPVWTIVRAFPAYASEEEFLRSYPTLRRGEAAAAMAYYAMHRDEIETVLQLQDESDTLPVEA